MSQYDKISTPLQQLIAQVVGEDIASRRLYKMPVVFEVSAGCVKKVSCWF